MSKEMAVIALGIWVIILPHLGVPHFWHTVLTTLTGFVIIGMGLYLRATVLSGGLPRSRHYPFVENTSEDAGTKNGYHEHQQDTAKIN